MSSNTKSNARRGALLSDEERTALEKRISADPKGGAMLSTREVALLAGVSLSTVRRLIASGGLPAAKIGRLPRIRYADFTAYLTVHRVVGKPVLVPPKKKRAASAGGPAARLQ
jgi:excisionase family DNA binding protein